MTLRVLIITVKTPTANAHAATKQYVDNKFAADGGISSLNDLDDVTIGAKLTLRSSYSPIQMTEMIRMTSSTTSAFQVTFQSPMQELLP